jgi:hypothetical protein
LRGGSRRVRDRLTYANVISTLALFLVLAGGVAYAAKVAKKSVGAPQLKANAVTTAKIKANAITTRKIRRNAVSNAKIKDGAIESQKIATGGVSGSDIDADSTPFGRVVHEARGSEIVAITGTKQTYPMGGGTYTQPANETDSFVGAIDVRFSAACDLPRSVSARVALDAADPLDPLGFEIVAAGTLLEESGGGTVSRRVELSPAATRFEPGTSRSHTLSLVVDGSCGSGEGISANLGAVNVIGTK